MDTNMNPDTKRELMDLNKGDRNEDLNNFMICKFGKTNSLRRRVAEHSKHYNAMTTSTHEPMIMNLETFVFIHPSSLTEAETRVREHFKHTQMWIEHELYRELICIHKKDLRSVRRLFADVGKLCNLSYEESIHKNEILVLQNEVLSLKNTLLKKQIADLSSVSHDVSENHEDGNLNL
jgi:hypothetical protein